MTSTCLRRLVCGSVAALPVGPVLAQPYQLASAVLDQGGSRGSSANYTINGSTAPGLAGSSANYRLRPGFPGQLTDAVSLGLSAPSPTVNETGTSQLSASLTFDDSTRLPLAANTLSWSVLSGPIATIDAAGLATAEAVYQNTNATIQGASAGVSGIFAFSVIESIPDNFRLYAGDQLPDPWQVQFLGLENPLGGQTANPDGDALNNLLEYAFGTDPANLLSGPGDISYHAGVVTQRGQPKLSLSANPGGVTFLAVFGRRKDYLTAGLTYTVQFSADLTGWQNSSATPNVIASDAEMDAVSVRYPFFLSDGRKAQFFRVRVTIQ